MFFSLVLVLFSYLLLADVLQLAVSDQMSLIPDFSVLYQNGIGWYKSDLGKKWDI
jgi:hypothetical protein